MQTTASSLSIRDLPYCAICAALIAICSWLTIPAAVPFTLQTFAVFLSLELLGGKRGTLSVLIFILLGCIGIPVFSGFMGGFGVLLGTTGGYIIGFIFMGLSYRLILHLFGEAPVIRVIALLVGLLICYTFGTAWFVLVYTAKTGPIGILAALGLCVFPFVLPDTIKLLLAFFLAKRLRKVLPL